MRAGLAGALFLAILVQGCYQDTPSPAFVYQKAGVQPATPQQEEIDKAACKGEGEDAAKAVIARQGGGVVSALAADAHQDSAEKDCMKQRGYDSKPPPVKGIFN